MKISALDRIFLFGASLLAAYQVVVGIEGLGSFTILCYTVGFGVILVACLLMIILGFDVLESPLVVILSTIIPLSLSTGLVSEFFPAWLPAYLVFSGLGLLAIILTRTVMYSKISVNPVLSKERILKYFPALLFWTTLAFVAGFALAKT